ncbi:MAG: hypothetical protein ACYC2I_13815 [Elusimicrobiales bacterium]
MPGRRNYKIRVRGKVRNSLLRRGGAVAGGVLGLLAAAWLSAAALKAARGFFGGGILSFRPDSFEVDCPAPPAAASARELMSRALNAPLSARRCAELADEIKRRHPGLSSVSVGRNFFTGKASVKAVPEGVVAPVLLNGSTAYLGTSGRFMPESLVRGDELPFAVSVRSGAGSAPDLAAFLAGLRPMAGLFSRRPLLLDCPGVSGDCRLGLEDGSTVLWGGFEFTRLKILRLNEVMEDAARKTGGPLRVDLRYFREGKIFVSALK